MQSDANLIELDLLRSGERLLASLELQAWIANQQPPPDYLVLVNRAWKRADGVCAFQIFPVQLVEPLPCISVPLRPGQDEVPLDLQFAFNRVYDTGPYRRGAVNYGQPPEPPLVGDQVAWAEQLLHAALPNPTSA